MPSFKLTIAYDGTDFVGWQRQAAGVSVQGLVEEALAPIEARPVAVIGAGRTDAGAHAEGQVAGFSIERWIEPETLVRALNARLPPAVRVLNAAVVSDRFHARFDALAKTYRYRLFGGSVLSPFAVRWVWHVPGPLDVDAMSQAAASLTGEHDFSAFRSAGTDVEGAVRTVYQSVVVGSSQTLVSERAAEGLRSFAAGPGYVTYTIRGSGFVRHMVRAIVGSLVEVGRGRRPAGWLREVLESRDRGSAGATAPPHGLALVRVEYPPLAAEP